MVDTTAILMLTATHDGMDKAWKLMHGLMRAAEYAGSIGRPAVTDDDEQSLTLDPNPTHAGREGG